ncbi:glycosyltransferase [Bradyrhizobium sp. ORS 86]|uniref:glycosyltransferase n=1 Tax=unclassified Bradyrhizobium TaxID=2631580 RepID=UPI00388EDF72
MFWLILRAHGQRGLLPVLYPVARAIRDPPNVSVIVPARNESDNLPRCLHSLLRQNYRQDRLHIVVVDDNSTDDTFATGHSFAARTRSLKVIRCPPLPPRWYGKPHACWIGVRMSCPEDDWLCFIDADVQAEPGLIGSAVTAARSQQLALLSLAPRQQLGSFPERLIIPCGLFLMAFRQDLKIVQSPHSNRVTANGQFMLVHRRAYELAGGHAAVHDAICEDLELARLIKKSGGRVLLQDGRLLLTARMYTGWKSLWMGFSKNAVEMLGGPTAAFVTALLALMLPPVSFLLPIMDGVRCASGHALDCVALVPAVTGTAAAAALHIAGALYFCTPFWYGLIFPLGYAVGGCLTLDSVRRHWRGDIIWKGRSYP